MHADIWDDVENTLGRASHHHLTSASPMSDIPPNIQRFNLTALRLFANLYDAFPSPIDIEYGYLGAESAPEGLAPADVLAYALGADEVVEWLEEEGFVRTTGRTVGATISGVRLTLKGLTVLGYIPTSIVPTESSEPIIDKIKRTLSKGIETAGSEGVKTLLGGVFRLAISYAPGSASIGSGINV